MLESPAKILVAEDNPALVAVISFNLRRSGLEVMAARNGREAWEAAQASTFDVVVTDHQMPEMTGVELSQKLRGLPQYAQTPIIMLTAKGLELDLNHLKTSLGIAAALPKPFSPVEMVKIVHDCLNRTHAAIA